MRTQRFRGRQDQQEQPEQRDRQAPRERRLPSKAQRVRRGRKELWDQPDLQVLLALTVLMEPLDLPGRQEPLVHKGRLVRQEAPEAWERPDRLDP